MKKTFIVAIASLTMLISTGCDSVVNSKISIEDYSKEIVGFWELETTSDADMNQNDQLRAIIEFAANDVVAFYDNVERVLDPNGYVEYIFSTTSIFRSHFGYYWIIGDLLCDKYNYSEYSCLEFGNPNCECNLHYGISHCTRILEMRRNKLILEVSGMDGHEEPFTMTLCRISKPEHISY